MGRNAALVCQALAFALVHDTVVPLSLFRFFRSRPVPGRHPPQDRVADSLHGLSYGLEFPAVLSCYDAVALRRARLRPHGASSHRMS